MAFSGDVSVMGLDEVISFLGTNGLDGVLTVCAAASSLKLYFREGAIVCPKGAPKRQSGRIDKGALAALLARGAKLSKSSGRLKTVEKGEKASNKKTERRVVAPKPKPNQRAIAPDVIEQILARAGDLDREELSQRIEETIQNVLLWYPAQFEFQPGNLPPHLLRDLKLGRTLGFEPNSILMEAARRRDNTSRVQGVKEALAAHAKAEVERSEQGKARRDLHGNLAGIGLAAVLQSLNTQRRTGTLTVFTDEREEHLYFRYGEAYVLIHEKGDDEFAKDFLGESWMDTVQISQDFASAHSGSLSESDLTEADLRAVKDKFLDMLFWDEAEFVFVKDALPPEFSEPGEKVSKIALQTGRFLLEAIQRLTEWDGVRKVIGSRAAVLDFMDFERKMDQSTAVSGRNLQIMTLIDGRLTFEQVVRLSGLEHLEVGRVVTELVDAGHLKVVEPD